MNATSGPCGPCTEIFWDQLEEVDGDRYLEIWNLVFMKYEMLQGEDQKMYVKSMMRRFHYLFLFSFLYYYRFYCPFSIVIQEDFEFTNHYRHYAPLERQCIDTGMGLERLASVVQSM